MNPATFNALLEQLDEIENAKEVFIRSGEHMIPIIQDLSEKFHFLVGSDPTF